MGSWRACEGRHLTTGLPAKTHPIALHQQALLTQNVSNTFGRCLVKGIAKGRSFEKGLAVRGGCREEILPMPEIEASFLYLFSYAPLGEGGHIVGVFFGGFVCRRPPPANPFSKPLKRGGRKKPQ